MSPSPLVSIVTASYNQAQFLDACIQSVLSQTYQNIEYFVLDADSKDNSAEIISRFASRLKYWHSKPDRGPADALNQGFAMAKGEILAFLNSDDLLMPDAVDTWVSTFAKNPAVDLVYGGIVYLDAAGRVTHRAGGRAKGYPACPWSLRTYAAGVMVVPQQSSAWTKTLYEKVGGFDPANRTNWDSEFFARAATCGFHFKDIPKILAGFRFHDESITVGLHSGLDEQNLQRRATAKALTHDICAAAGLTIPPFERAWRSRVFKLVHGLCLLRDRKSWDSVRFQGASA